MSVKVSWKFMHLNAIVFGFSKMNSSVMSILHCIVGIIAAGMQWPRVIRPSTWFKNNLCQSSVFRYFFFFSCRADADTISCTCPYLNLLIFGFLEHRISLTNSTEAQSTYIIMNLWIKNANPIPKRVTHISSHLENIYHDYLLAI